MNNSSTYIVNSIKVDKFLSDIDKDLIKYSKKEIGSGGDTRIWGIDKENELIKEITSFFIKNSSLKKEDTKNITAMYNIIPAEEGINSGDGWHFDSPLSQKKCFCYLSDVYAPQHGAIKFIRFANILNKLLYRISVVCIYLVSKNNRIPKLYLKILKLINGKEQYIFGSKGFTFIEDTSFPHKGGELLEKERHAVTLYYFKKDPTWLLSNKKNID